MSIGYAKIICCVVILFLKETKSLFNNKCCRQIILLEYNSLGLERSDNPRLLVLGLFQSRNKYYYTTSGCLSAFDQNFRLNPAMNVVPGIGKP